MNIQLLKQLRQTTKAPILLCKEAIDKTSDYESALAFIRKHFQINSERQADEGMVGIMIKENKAVMVHLASETDFACLSEAFIDMISAIMNATLNSQTNNVDDVIVEDGLSCQDFIRSRSTGIQENISLVKHKIYQAAPGYKLIKYIHNTSSYSRCVGKEGVLLQVNEACPNANAELIAMHIAALHELPLGITRNHIEKHHIDEALTLAAQKAQGKPDFVKDKIIEGSMNAFYQRVALVEQLCLTKEGSKVYEVLGEGNTIKSFTLRRT